MEVLVDSAATIIMLDLGVVSMHWFNPINLPFNLKEFFTHVNSKKPTRQKIGPIKDREGVLLNFNHDTAKLLDK